MPFLFSGFSFLDLIFNMVELKKLNPKLNYFGNSRVHSCPNANL